MQHLSLHRARGSQALAAIRTARAEVRDRIWQLAARDASNTDGQVIVNIDGVLVLAHSDKEDATRTWRKKTYGHHPLMAFVLRRARRGAAVAGQGGQQHRRRPHPDHPPSAGQLPNNFRRGRRTLIRTDSAGGTHKFLAWLTARGRWLSYSVGMTITEQIHQAVLKIPASAWTPAVEPGGQIRDGTWVAELAGDVLASWPQGMWLIVRKECPYPGAQLRFTDADGMRLTAFATNTQDAPIAALELRHRRRARAEDRIRAARATGLTNLPLDSAQNQIWLEIVQIALDLLAWVAMLALTGPARLWEPKRLRLRLFSATAQLVTTGRRRILRLAKHWPWSDVITGDLQRLTALPNPG
ncbi:IS1380 family transposase [Streptomyces sp. NPDC001680]